MSKTCARGFAVSLAVLFLASAVLAQEPQKKAPVSTAPGADCEPDTCMSKVLYVPDFPTPFELQEVVNTFRSVVDIANIYPEPSDHTIALKGTPEQLAIAEKLLSVLENLRSSGGHDRSSVLVYQFNGHLSGTAQAERMLAQHPRAASKMCDLSTCYIKAMYLPDLSVPELQNLNNRVRTTADIVRTGPISSRHVLVIEGTAEQIDVADTLFRSASAPQ